VGAQMIQGGLEAPAASNAAPAIKAAVGADAPAVATSRLCTPRRAYGGIAPAPLLAPGVQSSSFHPQLRATRPEPGPRHACVALSAGTSPTRR
jgi:hypothetical protein